MKLKREMSYIPRASMSGQPIKAGCAHHHSCERDRGRFCSTITPWSNKKNCFYLNSESNPGFLFMNVTPYHWAPTMYSISQVAVAGALGAACTITADPTQGWSLLVAGASAKQWRSYTRVRAGWRWKRADTTAANGQGGCASVRCSSSAKDGVARTPGV